MKKKLAIFLSVVIMLQSIINVNIIYAKQSDDEIIAGDKAAQAPDGFLVETSPNIKTDFTNDVPKDMQNHVITSGGEKVYTIDGKNAILGDVVVGSATNNSYVEVDCKLVKSTGVTSGAFSVTPFSTGDKSYTVRFAYVSAIKYNPETKMGNGSTVVRDRLAIVASSNTMVNNWVYGRISEKELGIQSSAMETPWFKMRAMSVDGVYYLSAYSEDGKLLDSISITAEELFGEDVDSACKNGGFQITSNSCEVLFDNLSTGNVELVKNPSFTFDTKSAKVNTPVGCSLMSEDGKTVSSKAFEILYDSEKAELDENGALVFNTVGKQQATARVFDVAKSSYSEYNAEIDIKEKLIFNEINIIPETETLYRNQEMSISVKGTDENGDVFEIDASEYEIAEPAQHTENTVTFTESGTRKIKVNTNGRTVEKDVYVSQYDGMIPNLTSTETEQWTSVSYSLSKKIGETVTEIPLSDYTVTADKEGLTIKDGTITADNVGEYTLSFTSDNMTEEVKFTVIEKQEGLIIDENFEDTDKNEYFMYPDDHVVSDNGNKVLRLADEETEFFGGESWKRYSIKARVKIATPVLDQRCDYATFEIKPQSRYSTYKNYLGGTGGIPCIYRINHNIDSGPHMRISAVAGSNINIEDGEYHDFYIEVSKTQVMFEIDGVKQYYNLSTNDMGYFTFMANNCEVYIDDLVVTKQKYYWGKEIKNITAQEEVVEVNPYEPWQFRAINAYILNYTDGTSAYITNWATSYSYTDSNSNSVIEFEQVDGFEYGEVLRKNTIMFKKDAPDGAEITVRGTYQGHTCEFKVKAKRPDPNQEYIDYVKSRADIHRENYAFRLVYGYNKGLDNGPGSSSTLSHRNAVMTIYPKIRDYSSMFKWYARSAEYEDKYVGRGVDAGDFVILQAMEIYKNLKGIANVSDEAWDYWKDYMLSYKWVYPDNNMSENHKMIYFCTAILAGEAWPDEVMYNGMTGRETAEQQKKYLIDWFNHRINRGLMEFDSPNYGGIDIFAGELFYHSVQDDKLKQLAYDLVTLILAEMVPDSLEDGMTGAGMRVYHSAETTTKLKPIGFFFNTSTYMTDEFYHMNVQEGHFAFTDYMPPDALFEIAVDERTIENKERHQNYTLLDDKTVTESVRKYTYRTPEYAVGSFVYQDDMSKYRQSNNTLYANNGTYTAATPIYAAHQDIEFTMEFGRGNGAIITENHPKSTSGDFYDDKDCLCGMYFQDKGATIGMHKIELKTRGQYTHFFIPKKNLQYIEETDGWIFVNHYGVFAAIKPMVDGKVNGTLYQWGDPERTYSGLKRSDCEVILNSTNTAFVSEMTSEKDFGGTFEEFKTKVLENEKNIVYSISDKGYYLEYTSIDGSKIKVDYTNNKRYLNDAEVDFEEYKIYDNPYVQAEWDGDSVEIKGTKSSYTINVCRPYLTLNKARDYIKRIDALQQKLTYEKKFGRGTTTIAANKDEIIECINLNVIYDENGRLYDVVMKKVETLSELIESIYNSANAREKESIEDVKQGLDSYKKQ